MTTITLKDIPPKIHKALKLRAQRHGRSLNKEILASLEALVTPKTLHYNSFITEIRANRDNFPGPLTDQLIEDAHDTGRP